MSHCNEEEQFACVNCSKAKTLRGIIPAWVRPALIIFFAYPWQKDICKDCAENFTMIGAFLSFFLFVGLLIFVIYWAAS